MSKTKTVVTYSAGGVVLRQQNGALDVVLVGQSVKNTWGLPKGGPAKGESLEQTAVRETREETGLDVCPLGPIGEITYWFATSGKRFHKTVHYFLMEPVGGDISRHDAENDRVAFVPVAEAYQRMSYQNEVAMVRKAVELWESRRPRPTASP